MRALIFPGQGAQFVGMGKDLYDKSASAKELFELANKILGFNITEIMFAGTDEDLKKTSVTQPAIFLHSVILAKTLGDSLKPEMVAGHSLGEFSAMVVAGALSFEEGLVLVSKHAQAMQMACNVKPSTMAAVLGLADDLVEKACAEINATGEVVVPANYNSPGQLVISGSVEGIDAIIRLKELGAKRAIKLPVNGAFHSPLMQPARTDFDIAVAAANFTKPFCPVYQNVNALPSTEPETLRKFAKEQLTSPVFWTQTVQNMVKDGADDFYEVGPGKVLQGLVLKIEKNVKAISAVFE